MQLLNAVIGIYFCVGVMQKHAQQKNKTIKCRLLQVDICICYQRVLSILKSTTFVTGA
ncbi:MAG: hypothetical protein Q8N96_05185 [Methylovulum sp.]|nr:hypothetical protein [Methylovulum sp.]